MKKILLSFHNQNIELAKRLARRGYTIQVFHDHFQKVLADLDIKSERVAESVSDKIMESAMRDSIQILDSIREPIESNLDKSVATFMAETMPSYLYTKIPNMVAFLYSIEEARPDLIVLHNDVEPHTRLLALWAKEQNIPCLHVPHAVYLDVDKGDPGDDVHDLITASHLAAAGEYQQEWYVKRGFPTENIRITGLPKFDKMAGLSYNKDKAQVLLGLNTRRPTMVYASSWPQNTNLLGMHGGVEEAYRMILSVAKEVPELQLVVKVHPNSNATEQHIQIAQEMDVPCFVTPYHLEVVLQAADVVYAYGPSNILLEASYIPYVRLMCTHGYNDKEVVITGTHPSTEEMIGTLKAVFATAGPDKTGFRRKYCGSPGGATERVLSFIEELCPL